MAFEEKRSHLRRYFGVDERYLIEYKESGKFFQKKEVALTLNMSGSGLLFRSTKIIPINTILDTTVTLPHIKKPIHFQARVVRTDPTHREGIYDIAIFYTEISDPDRAVIDQFCREKMEQEKKPENEAQKPPVS